MNMEENNNKLPIEQEIDLMELAQKVWNERKLVFKSCGIAIIIGLIVGFSIPKEYTSEILIAPESTSSKSSSSLSSLAAMAGINMLGSTSSRDAIYPDLYPDIVSSTPFLVELFNIPITIEIEDMPQTMPLSEYILEHQKGPWWGYITSAPFKVLAWGISLFKETEEEEDNDAAKKINTFKLTKDEAAIAKGISGRINITVDKKTWITSLSVTMQDPVIAATVADSVRVRLQNYITNYRTDKARNTLTYTQKLYNEAKDEYYKAQEEYAKYSDRNQNLILQSSRAELERLQNERNLTYNTYTQMAQQLQLAKAKVDEVTPVYAIIQPASVPLRQSKPSKAKILIAFIFLAGAGSVGWILFLKDMVASWRDKK